MQRIEIIDCVGREYHNANIENGEFSYAKALNENISGHKFLDIRFYDDKTKVAILIETKQKFNLKKDKKQLFDYVALEKKLSQQVKIIAILANTNDEKIKVWKITNGIEDELDDNIYKEKIGAVSVKQLGRTAKERKNS